MTDNRTQFERQLAAYQPRLLRDVTLPTGDSLRKSPSVSEKLTRLVQTWQSFDRKVRPHLVAGVCCFLLGAVTMFVLMTCGFDPEPMRSQPLASKPVSVKRTYLTYPIDLDEVRTPADLMTRIRRQPVIVVKPEPEVTTLRAFPTLGDSEIW